MLIYVHFSLISYQLCHHVGVSSQHFHLKVSIGVVNLVCLVDDALDLFVFLVHAYWNKYKSIHIDSLIVLHPKWLEQSAPWRACSPLWDWHELYVCISLILLGLKKTRSAKNYQCGQWLWMKKEFQRRLQAWQNTRFAQSSNNRNPLRNHAQRYRVAWWDQTCCLWMTPWHLNMDDNDH